MVTHGLMDLLKVHIFAADVKAENIEEGVKTTSMNEKDFLGQRRKTRS
jgi:hypothetical protein